MMSTVFFAILLGATCPLEAASLGVISREVTTGNIKSTSGESNYQTLLDTYNSSSSPASISDFINQSAKTCVIASEEDQDLNTVSYTLVHAYCAKILVAASEAKDIPAIPAYDIPSAGPLLPARHVNEIPAKHIPATSEICDTKANNKLLMGGDWIKNASSDQLSVFSNKVEGSNFVISVANNSQGIYSDIGGDVTISIRKKDGLFPFLVESSKGIVYSGYCY